MSTMVLAYGLLAPIANELVVRDQLWLAHQFYNALIEIARQGRQQVRVAQMAIPELAEATRALAQREAEYERLDRLRRRGPNERLGETAEDVPTETEVDRALTQVAEARKAHQQAKAPFRAQLEPQYKLIQQWEHDQRLQAQHQSGLYWGTYNRIKQAADQAIRSPSPPRFRAWTGRGQVSVQIQSTHPLRDLFGDDSRVSVDPIDPDAWNPELPRGGQRRLRRTHLHLRVGVAGEQVTWPLLLHRPLPPNAVVKQVTVLREPCHGHTRARWAVQFTVDVPEVALKDYRHGPIVAVNLGWRALPDGALRVATWVDSEGNTGELQLDRTHFRGRLERARRIRAHRDQLLNELKADLAKLGCKEGARSRSHRRFHRLWRELQADLAPVVAEGGAKTVERAEPPRRSRPPRETPCLDLDAATRSRTLERLETWRHRDRHLDQYEEGCRCGALRYRREAYRRLAHELAQRYAAIVVECYDLRPIVTDPERSPKAAGQRVEGCPSQARLILHSTGTREGCVVLANKTWSRLATQVCFACGYGALPDERWDAAASIWHTCAGCGEEFDQDVNNARHLLAHARETVRGLDPSQARKAKRAPKFAKRHKQSGEETAQAQVPEAAK